MMQPILDYRAEIALNAILEGLNALPDDDLFRLAEDTFGFDLETPFENEKDELVPPEAEDALAYIEGRMLDMLSAAKLAKFSYVDYEWAKREGLVS